MGKKYYCDYCDKTMVATPSIIKTHNSGVGHRKLMLDHYAQYKDPETILKEESTKLRCAKYPSGNCAFGSICRFSHYSQEQINVLQEYVAAKNRNQTDIPQPSFEELYQNLQDKKSQTQPADSDNTVIYDSNGVTHVLPWTYNPIFDGFGDNLPPSIKRLKVDDFYNANITEWG